jgi:Mg2+/Co2+ transporter CorB
MSVEDWLSILVIVFCLGLSFFFSGSETALTAFSRARMLRLEKTGNRRAALVNRLLDTRERLIGAILTGNNIVNIAASSLTTGLLLSWFGDVGVLYATMVMTVAIVVFTECFPRRWRSMPRIGSRCACPVSWIVRVLGRCWWGSRPGAVLHAGARLLGTD